MVSCAPVRHHPFIAMNFRPKHGSAKGLRDNAVLISDVTFRFMWSSAMAVDRSDIAKLANLARIAISDDAADEVAASISNILARVNKLKAVNTDGVLPMAHPLDAVQRLRADVVTEPNQRELFQSIAPATQDGLYLVPQVIE